MLIIGGTGRLGTMLQNRLSDCDVTTLSRRELPERTNHISADVASFVDYAGFDVVINCAAMKDVAKCEANISECVNINFYGTLHSVQAAKRAGVGRYIYISTDMAVEPQSVYGASKMLADAAVIDAAKGSQMQSAVIRLGNIIAKNGSILTLLASKAQELGYVPITDTGMTRFLMTDMECADFVVDVINREVLSGEIYAPRCKSYRITDVAEAVAGGYSTKIVGLRPGDMLAVTMVSQRESARTSIEGNTYIIEPEWSTKDISAVGGAINSANNYSFASVDELRELFMSLNAQ